MATLPQISNIFNLMVQQPQSGLLFYHWGYRYDINREITNNFDPKSRKGRQYPALQMDVPNVLTTLGEPSEESQQQEVEMVLYFDNLQDYNNNGTQKVLNTIEQMDILRVIARNFMANLPLVLDKYDVGFIKPNIRYIPRSNLHNDKLITLECSFVLVTQLECVDGSNLMDLDLFPSTLSEADIENIRP